jgi:hypothetical protein
MFFPDGWVAGCRGINKIAGCARYKTISKMKQIIIVL